MGDRVILHCDCNSFYASVELLHYPELREVPVAVSGNIDDRHGIILAKNEAAKKLGIQTAETVWQARKKCPKLKLLQPHHNEYRIYSKKINDIYKTYTDRVEAFGIDESWLDVTGSWQLFGKTPKMVADRIRAQVQRETGLTISIGISFNKVFAKLGSDYKKPDATTEITRENYQDKLWPLPVTAMLYVGEKAKQSLGELNIKTIENLAKTNVELLIQVLGKQGRQLHEYANGEDNAPVLRVGENEPVKSIGNGLTFRRNLTGNRDIRTAVGGLSDEVASRLRSNGLYATGLAVQIKNPDLKSISRQKQLRYATNLTKDIVEAAMELIQENWNFSKPIRMLTITAQSLTDMPFAEQTSLYGEKQSINEKREKLETSIDKIRHKYGRTSILGAGLLRNNLGLDNEARPNYVDEKNKKENEESEDC